MTHSKNERMTNHEKEILKLGFGRFGFNIEFREDAKDSRVVFSAEDAQKILNHLKVLDNAAGKL